MLGVHSRCSCLRVRFRNCNARTLGVGLGEDLCRDQSKTEKVDLKSW